MGFFGVFEVKSFKGGFMSDLKEKLGIEKDRPIPADFNIPYYIHQDDLNKLDMSHKRIEKWIVFVCIIIFIAFVGTNAAWIWYEHQYQDVMTETYSATSDDGGNAIANCEGSVVIGDQGGLHENKKTSKTNP